MSIFNILYAFIKFVIYIYLILFQVTTLVEEKQNLSIEYEKLADRLNQAENLDDPRFVDSVPIVLFIHALRDCIGKSVVKVFGLMVFIFLYNM